MKVIITIAGVFILALIVTPVAPGFGFGLIGLGGIALLSLVWGHQYGIEKKKWLEEEALRAEIRASVPPPADTSPATPPHGIGSGNAEEVPTQPAWKRTPEGEANADRVEYCTPVAFQAPGRARLELEINETE